MTTFATRGIFNSILLNVKKQRTIQRLASAYKASILNENDSPLVFEEIKKPKLKSEEIRIQVAYCSVNSADVHSFKDGSRDLPFIPGYELSGEILEMGSKVKCDFQIGSRVAALNLKNFGGLAEECVVHKDDVWHVPPNVTLEDAAVITYGHSLALYTFAKLCEIKDTNTIVISTGPAGLGLAGVDVAANIYKSKVIAVTDTEVSSELTRERGAFQTMHIHENLRKDILKLLGTDGADIVYDAVGGNMHRELASCVSTNGKIFNASQEIVKTMPAPPAHSTLTVVSLIKLKEQNLELYRQIVNDTLEMADEGIIAAHISGKYDFKDVNKAIEFINSKKCTGKVLVKVD